MADKENEGGVAVAEETEQKSFLQDDILSALANDLGIVLPGEDEEKKADEPPTAPEIKPASETPPQPKAEEKPKVSIKPKEDVRKVVDEEISKRLSALSVPPTPPAPKPEEKKADESKPEDSGLSDEQREELVDAEYAAKVDPKLKDLPKKIREFNAALEQYAKKAREEDPDRSLDETDAEFVAWVKKHKPWNANERQRVRIERIADEKAEAKLRERDAETAKRLEKAELEAREAKAGPQIEKAINEFASEYDKETKTDDPGEAEIYTEFRTYAEDLARDVLRLAHGIDKFGDTKNPPELNQRHTWLANFVNHQAAIFEAKGGEQRVRDGKTFVAPMKAAQLAAANDTATLAKVWTFDTNDITRILRTHAVNAAKQKIKEEDEKAQRRGYVKVKKNADAKTSEEIKPTTGPKAGSTPAPGAADLAGDKQVNHIGKEIVEALGLLG